jgi:membrane associated rhomboid family serine protease
MAAGVFGGVLLFILLGVAPDTDVLAHFGGFVSGLFLGALLNLAPPSAPRPKANLLSALLFALLVILPWWLAFKRA